MTHPLIPFDAHTTAAEVAAGLDLSDLAVVVTGASSGLGAETARVLAAQGARVTLAVRDLDAGRRTAAEIGRSLAGTPRPERLQVTHLDLADLGTVDRFVDGWTGPLDVLVNNAGVMATPFGRTAQGWETQFGTNHLGHFALTTGLYDALAESGRARVVVVSSVGHVNGDVDLDDPNFEHRAYDPWSAYGQSKTANILFAVEASRRWATDGPDSVVVNSLNPGRIASTNLGRHTAALTPAPASFDPSGTTGVSVKNIAQGAATTVLLAVSPLVSGVTGEYFEDCQVAGPHVAGVRRGIAAHARDPERARLLWELSEQLVADAHR